MSDQIKNQQTKAEKWFRELRNQMVGSMQKLDGSEFIEKEWQRPGGGGGLMSLLTVSYTHLTLPTKRIV